MNAVSLGILGGGQLGRMSAMAAARLGISCVIYTPDENSPASQVAAETIVASYDDKASLKSFCEKVNFITYEFENIPLETIDILKAFKQVYPGRQLLEISQDRIAEKSFLNNIGISTTSWSAIERPEDILSVLNEWNCDSGILKTTKFGYDGKGQAKVYKEKNNESLIKKFQGQKFILEKIVDFVCEISVIVCRDVFGSMEVYGPVLNEHKNHILDRSVYPAPIEKSLSSRAIAMAETLAEAVGLVGVLTLEMFITKDGDIIANEIAPRTHNSGHWTIDACTVSQFENHVRAVCGMPLGEPMPHSGAEMINLIGTSIEQAQSYLTHSNACVHIYGKQGVHEGRKMGHVTLLKNKTSDK